MCFRLLVWSSFYVTLENCQMINAGLHFREIYIHKKLPTINNIVINRTSANQGPFSRLVNKVNTHIVCLMGEANLSHKMGKLPRSWGDNKACWSKHCWIISRGILQPLRIIYHLVFVRSSCRILQCHARNFNTHECQVEIILINKLCLWYDLNNYLFNYDYTTINDQT